MSSEPDSAPSEWWWLCLVACDLVWCAACVLLCDLCGTLECECDACGALECDACGALECDADLCSVECVRVCVAAGLECEAGRECDRECVGGRVWLGVGDRVLVLLTLGLLLCVRESVGADVWLRVCVLGEEWLLVCVFALEWLRVCVRAALPLLPLVVLGELGAVMDELGEEDAEDVGVMLGVVWKLGSSITMRPSPPAPPPASPPVPCPLT